MAKFNASQLITQRQQVSLLVRKGLIERALDFNIILDDVAITELAFSPQYSAAVEAKQVAAQEGKTNIQPFHPPHSSSTCIVFGRKSHSAASGEDRPG